MSLDIKICGLSTPETVAAALERGASHVGFIFFPQSPRNVSPETAGRLRQPARGRAKAVAVTVDADGATRDGNASHRRRFCVYWSSVTMPSTAKITAATTWTARVGRRPANL